MLQHEFEDKLSALVAEAMEGGLTAEDILDGIECQKQCLIDEIASGEED